MFVEPNVTLTSFSRNRFLISLFRDRFFFPCSFSEFQWFGDFVTSNTVGEDDSLKEHWQVKKEMALRKMALFWKVQFSDIQEVRSGYSMMITFVVE